MLVVFSIKWRDDVMFFIEFAQVLAENSVFLAIATLLFTFDVSSHESGLP